VYGHELLYGINMTVAITEITLSTLFASMITGSQFKINVMFTAAPIPYRTFHTYGRLQIVLADKNGLNETHEITQ